jgi:hypothetical protein
MIDQRETDGDEHRCYLMKVITETRRAHQIWFLRFHDYHYACFSLILFYCK